MRKNRYPVDTDQFQKLSGPGTKAIEWRELVVMIEGMIIDEHHHYRRVRRVQPLQK